MGYWGEILTNKLTPGTEPNWSNSLTKSPKYSERTKLKCSRNFGGKNPTLIDGSGGDTWVKNSQTRKMPLNGSHRGRFHGLRADKFAGPFTGLTVSMVGEKPPRSLTPIGGPTTKKPPRKLPPQ